jgi:hypothetical protein
MQRPGHQPGRPTQPLVMMAHADCWRRSGGGALVSLS